MKKRRLRVLPMAILTLFTVFLVVVAIIIIVNNRDIPLPMEYGDIIEEVAYREGIAEHILYAVIFTESKSQREVMVIGTRWVNININSVALSLQHIIINV